MEMKFYSPLTAEFFPDEPDWEDESYNEYEGYPMDGHDLLQYADAVDEAVKKDIADFNGDLMQYYHEDDSVRQKVVSAVPSVEIHGNKLCGCLNVELRESLNEGEQAVLCDYISGQYSDGWGEGFEQRDIRVEEGTLAVHFWQEDGFKMTPTFEKTQEQVQMTQRPKMKLLGEDGNIFAIMGRASLLLKNAGQSDKAKEKYGTEFWRPALFAMLTAVQQGRVNAVMVQSLDRLSHDITTLYRILRFLQNHGAILITTKTNLQYELYLTGLENRLLN